MIESIAEERVRITRQIELIEHLVLGCELEEADRARAALSTMYDALERLSRDNKLSNVVRDSSL